jgi:hypothetical protein
LRPGSPPAHHRRIATRAVIVVVAATIARLAAAALVASVYGAAGWWTVLGTGLLAIAVFGVAIHRHPAPSSPGSSRFCPRAVR